MKKLYESPLVEIEKFTIVNIVTDVSTNTEEPTTTGGVGDNGEFVEL